MPDDIGEQLTILSLAWSCLWTLSDEMFHYHLSQSEYAIFFLSLIFVIRFFACFCCLQLNAN